MARTASNMIPLKTRAPGFELVDTVSGKMMSLKQLQGDRGTVIFFICNHCPFVIHVNIELVNVANKYSLKGISFIAISSNDIDKYPQDGPGFMQRNAKQNNFPFPYLFDPTQEVAKAYDAACTPDTYVFDDDLRLLYRGQIDDSRPGNGVVVSAKDLRTALDDLLEGKTISSIQKPSIGCGIKWK
jgi:peroxiredoxin